MAIDFQDTMEDTDETNLSAHTPTPNGGTVWSVNLVASSTAKIDTAQAHTGSSSCRLSTSTTYTSQPQCGHAFTGVEEVTAFASYRQETVSRATRTWQLQVNNVGNSNIGVVIHIVNADIYYYNATTMTDSGCNIFNNTWYRFKVVANASTKTYMAYIIGGDFMDWTALTPTPASFYQASTWSGNMGYIYTRMFDNVNPPIALNGWVDDVQIGEDGGQPFSVRGEGVPGMAKLGTRVM